MGVKAMLAKPMGSGIVEGSAQEHPDSRSDSLAEALSERHLTEEIVDQIEAKREESTVAHLKAEIEQLLSDRATVSAWMREPDYLENATLEWLTAWLNRRPLKATS